ncbi:hypothetical protein USB125703_01339 [Pseudoclavibacter triregionum]|nr:hypothetical protein USB125703_01339 [Pseudoclavibacter triregionum]
MDQLTGPLWIVAAAALALAAGLVIGWMAGRQRQVAALAAAAAEREGLEAQLERADEELARARGDADLARRETAELREAERRRELAEREEREQDHRVLEAIAPVRQQLEHMQRAVAAMEEQRLEQHGELSEQLRRQHESDRELRETTSALASALRSSSARGSWGEAQLRNIVESAGLIDRVDFDEQVTVEGEGGRGRPDLVVRLPGDAHLALDAKAPLDAYLSACAEPESGGDAASRARRAELLARHAKAVRGHVDALAKRDYASAFAGSPALVVCFMPSEAALSAALRADPRLLDDAFAKGVALTSPVSLWSTLKAVATAWRHERLEESAEEVIRLGSQLAQRLGTTAEHLAKLGRSIDSTVASYNQAIGSIEGRVLPAARKLAAL